MAYTYNRNAFKAGRAESLPILLRTYCSLVALELGLKDVLGLPESPDNAGHDLPDLLNQLKKQNKRATPSINCIQTQLRNQLTAIRCQGIRGMAQSVPAQSYPHIRYMRHSTDWQSDSSTDHQLRVVLSTVGKLVSSLTHYGIDI
jgi:hypothetical protein